MGEPGQPGELGERGEPREPGERGEGPSYLLSSSIIDGSICTVSS